MRNLCKPVSFPLRLATAASLVISAAVALTVGSREAAALPSFASQTGQPCTACHVGSYGPQLTPLGRSFKIGGYTRRGGTGWDSYVPLSAMVITSFNRTDAKFPDDQIPHHYNSNNNVSLDQISAFVAGGIGEHTGGFIQFTWSDIDNAKHLDNTDLRPYTTTLELMDRELRIGTTVNNGPTVQDPYNSTFAWGYPFVASGIAPTPAANVMLQSGLTGNTLGYTVCAWYDQSLYVEAGAYHTLSRWALGRIGNDFGIGSTRSPAPYARIAYEWNWNRQSAHVGGLFMRALVNPPTGDPFHTDGSMGADTYTDFAADASYQFLGDGTHIVVVQGIFTHEIQRLKGTTAMFNAANGTSFGPNSHLDQVRLNVSYWYQNTYGLTAAWQKTWGPANPVLYQPAELTGSNNSKPNSNAFIFEADWVPFGKADSPLAPFLNLKLGLQYVVYTQFNGGAHNYDGFGRNASGNNTLFLFAWLSF